MGFAIFLTLRQKNWQWLQTDVKDCLFINKLRKRSFFDLTASPSVARLRSRMPSATKNLFLKKKVRETEGFSGTFQKDFFRFARLFTVSARHNNAHNPRNPETIPCRTQSHFYHNSP